MPERLTAQEGAQLLTLARAAIHDAVEPTRTERRVASALKAMRLGAGLQVPRGVFVTLRKPGTGTKPGDLRGCIGTLAALEPQTPPTPLFRNVLEVAPKAALDDPRFRPLRSGEIDGLTVEISALTPRRRIASVDEIRIGEHGVELEARGRHAVFLPQVASEHGWDVEELMARLARKAGLRETPRDDWELWVFESESFRDPA